MKNILQRFDTIQRVSQAIVERQKSFFTHGAIAMKPLVLREIADELGLHESTISRVTTAKYMSTPFGTFELKYFFGSSLNTEAGGNASSTAVRALIKQIVAAEDPAKPLSRQPDLADARRAGHPGRAPHRREVPRGAEDRADPAAQGDVTRCTDAVAAVPAVCRGRRAAARRRSPHAAAAGARCVEARGGVALEGEPLEVMTLEPREPARAARADRGRRAAPTATSTTCTTSPAASTGREWITPRHTLRVDTTAQRSPLRSLNFAALRVKDAVCDMLRDATGERPSVDTRIPTCSWCCTSAETHAALYVDSSGESLFKRGWRDRQGRRAAEGNARRRDARRGRLARHARGRRRAARPVLRLRHDRDRGGADRLRHRARPEAALRVRAPAAVRDRRDARRMAAPEEPRAGARPCRARADLRAATSRSAWSTSRAAMPSAPASRTSITFNGGDALERPAPSIASELPGTLMINPPYGERIEPKVRAANRARMEHANDDSADTTRCGRRDSRIGCRATSSRASRRHWKRAYTSHPAGWTAWVLSPDMKLPSAMRLKESRAADVERPDRVPAVPLRPGRRLGSSERRRRDSARRLKRTPGEDGQRRRVGPHYPRAER